MLEFQNSYLTLGSQFYQNIVPAQPDKPTTLLFNNKLAQELNFPDAFINDKSAVSKLFSGDLSGQQITPVALAYAGHQFGHFNPQLGDGRAHLLGEIIDQHNKVQEIQLKGSGQTPFSRQGDGKCALGPAVREYVMSEAMFALGVPTSRCLSVVRTNEVVFREQALPGAVVSRVASSHIRVGSFQYFAARNDFDSVKTLANFAIERHYSHIDISNEDYLLEFLAAVIDKQIELVVHWLRVGFIHGVMNTDNTAISGETIDYGPCAMMADYHPGTVFSSIDQNGRYAYGNQPAICQWNMARFAETLLPLIDADSEQAVAKVKPIIMAFSDKFNDANNAMMVNKIGLIDVNKTTLQLVEQLLNIMQEEQLDYTATFVQLEQSLSDQQLAQAVPQVLQAWLVSWQQQINDVQQTVALMRKTNPLVIPRNHHVEAIITQSYDNALQQVDDSTHIDEFLTVMSSPYQQQQDTGKYQDLPADGDRHYRTFCGT
ncbi:YdiU family protein [Thalassotalea sp. HSM 43]|uniref:protein adenylyltransferase SelO n=1 Tax=Thalassotalea sp. HSM 43 TaxID=2552945 RepID=UPI00107FEF8A|nr:YdiU family protein [Thalassotalea sp. HSM 43]QBY04605.1 YdiU family protein [Thalassotalea sp. HSM 43]